MFKKLLPSNLDFFDLFERHAMLGLEAARTMHAVLQNLSDPSYRRQLAKIEELEHQCDEVVHIEVELLRKSFITPFEREEIRELMVALDDIVDFIEAAAHRVVLYEIMSVPDEVVQLAGVLVQAQEKVQEMVKMLRHLKETVNPHEVLKGLNSLENEADRLHRSGIAALFKGGFDPLTVIKLKELYEIIESATDSCEDVGYVVEGIVIEHKG
ncbi:MAG: DUF47 domain-containing protein [Deltaproteobacteria bacterium]|nr:DUF47 domain-containing protein [Deltaproteobacteria bacterium]